MKLVSCFAAVLICGILATTAQAGPIRRLAGRVVEVEKKVTKTVVRGCKCN